MELNHHVQEVYFFSKTGEKIKHTKKRALFPVFLQKET